MTPRANRAELSNFLIALGNERLPVNNAVSIVRECTSIDTVFRDVRASSRSSNSSGENEVYESDFEVCAFAPQSRFQPDN